MKLSFSKLLENGFVMLDGATGTELIKEGMPSGVCPEAWVLENPEAIKRVQRRYIDAGSQIVYAPSFGANRAKLEEYGLAEKTREINIELARISSENAHDALCFGDLAPTGDFYYPFGETSFDSAVDIYSEQIRALVEGGVDGIVIETMMDIQEVRAALLAARSITDLPVIVTMTFDGEGRTLNGTEILAALDIVQSLGADAFGCNCSTGPDEMIPLLASIAPYSRIPLIAKPNAGLPKLVKGETVFTMNAETFASFASEIESAGIHIVGGCCGTTPEHIAALHDSLKDKKPSHIEKEKAFTLSSAQSCLVSGENFPVRYFQIDSENSVFKTTTSNQLSHNLKAITMAGSIPLINECENEDAVRTFPGTLLVQVHSDELQKMQSTFDFGCRYIIDIETEDALSKLAQSTQIQEYSERILLLVPQESPASFIRTVKASSFQWAVRSQPSASSDFWKTVHQLGPLIEEGMAFYLSDEYSDVLHNMIVSFNALSGRDAKLKEYMNYFSTDRSSADSASGQNTYPPVFQAVLTGDDASIEKLIRAELEKGVSAREIVDSFLIPAINEVGTRYEKKEYFLPQLIMSADTMSLGFSVLEPILLQESSENRKDGIIVIATVKGDIHDIGKNIVALMLKNYNFEVHDLGKDVDEIRIIEEARKLNADIICLSALMTTTMTEMETVVKYAKEKGLSSRIMIGGAVVDQNYADEIGADGYSKDAMDAVKLARKLQGITM